jgi:RimJ/RimL family protein N-acetyltransferase
MGPVLETARLILRPPVEADFDAWAAFMADGQAARFIGGVQPRTIAWRGMAAIAGSWALRGYGMFSVIERESGRWIGRIGPWMPPDWPGPEIAYGLARAAWGRGYATEGVTAAINFAFDTLGWAEVIHCIDEENPASQKVAKRLGATNRGRCKLPPPYAEDKIEIWGQTVGKWRAENL